ncbi:MAG: DUF763 domain-containing protein [Candidatus Bathyarchaeia archaeon]
MAVRTGGFDLWLHGGPAPRWLLVRMRKLARGILGVMTDDLGTRGVLQRISDPLWFQCLSYALAFDWDSSGTTTVTCGVLKHVLKGEMGLRVAGGKGAQSLAAQPEIVQIADEYSLSTHAADQLAYSSRMVAKIDNAALQDGHQLYHHAMFIDENGDWTVVQQGLNPQRQTARRYHWLSANVKSFVDEPHTGIQGTPVEQPVLNMVSRDSRSCRETSVDLASHATKEIRRSYLSIRPANQHTLTDWTPTTTDATLQSPHYSFAKSNINWRALEEAYELRPDNYEELLSIRGIGPATVRGLALISWLIYGSKPSWKDPLAYTFAFGGKDGVPYPVNRRVMDEAAAYLKQAVEAAEVDRSLKLKALKALGRAYIRKQ